MSRGSSPAPGFVSANRTPRLGRHYCKPLFLGVLAWFLLGPGASAVKGQSYLESIGVPPFTSALPVESGFINAANGNLHLEIPLASYPQRGGREFKVSLMYDSAIWKSASSSWQPANSSFMGGWRLVISGNQGSVDFDDYETTWCDYMSSYRWTNYEPFYWTAKDGTMRVFSIHTRQDGWPGECGGLGGGPSIDDDSAYATDGSGYRMDVTNYVDATVYAPDGTVVYSASTQKRKDTNGNYYLSSSGTYTDTAGRPTVTTTLNCNSDSNKICYDVRNSQGSISRYTLTKQTINVYTNFGVSGVTEYSGTITAIQSITLPDNTTYSFGYDSGTTAGHYGLITSMTLPSGGQISYSWSVFTDARSGKYTWISGRTTPDDSWSYALQVINSCGAGQVNCQQKLTVTKPSGDVSVNTFTLNGGAWHTQAQHYNGSVSSSNLLATVKDCFSFVTVTNGQCTYSVTTAASATNVRRTARTTFLPGGSGTDIYQTNTYAYDTYGNPTQIKEWKFYTGTLPSTADRTTTITYETGASYAAKNIYNRPKTVTVTGGGGTLAETKYTYDEGTPASATGTVNHDDANYGTSNTVRGNVTKIERLVGGTTYLSKSMTYDMTGQLKTSTDWKGNTTSYSYTDSYVDDNTSYSNPPSAHSTSTPTNACLTNVTAPLSSGNTTFKCYWGTGQVASATDANSNTTYFHFDNMGRPTATSQPNGGWNLTKYPNSTTVDAYTGITASFTSSPSCTGGSGGCRHDQALLDGLGRVADQVLKSDPDGETTVETDYDSSGRVLRTSNPYRNTSDTTYGWETPTYDGLNRLVQSIHADGARANTFYGAAVGGAGGRTTQVGSTTTYGLGYPILSKDEAGKLTQTWVDGFGRVIEVNEPAGSSTVGTPGAGSATVSGTEGVWTGGSGPGSGSSSVGGSEQSVGTVRGTGSVTISGSLVNNEYWDDCVDEDYHGDCIGGWVDDYDDGTVTITVNGMQKSVCFKKTLACNYRDTAAEIATEMRTRINADSNYPVTASGTGGIITLTAKQYGASTNYPLSVSVSSNYDSFAGTTKSGPTLTGGTTVYDSGSVGIRVTGSFTGSPFTATASYGQSSTTSSVAAALRNYFNNNSGSPVTASGTGATVTLTAKTGGASTNYSVSAATCTYNTTKFSQCSFPISTNNLTGGYDATTYDAGTVSITVGGFQAQATYGETSTASSLASALAAIFTANSTSPVTATASGATINFEARAVGSSTNYSVSTNSSSNLPAIFNPASFSASGSALTGGTDSTSLGTSVAATLYTYDLNNNLTGVVTPTTQNTCNSAFSRCYTFDLLSRITSSTTPESGTTYTYYTTSGGAVCSGDPTAVCRRTDSRSITTTYTYDNLSRLTGLDYSDSTPDLTYSYDQTTYNGLTITNGKNRRTGMSDGSGLTAWSYDQVGNVLKEQRKITAYGLDVTKTIEYTYNKDGSIASIKYPGGRTVNYTVGNAQRPTEAKDTTNTINYATPSSLDMYSPAGAAASIVFGYVSGGGITETRGYNSRLRLQLTGIQALAAASSTIVLDLSYGYATSTILNNGNVLTQGNNLSGESGRTQDYTYDSLNRLLTAQSQATSGGDCWGQAFGNNATPPTAATDALANLFYTSSTKCSSPAPQFAGDGYNHISTSGFSYDSAGNTTGDAQWSYTYDAENRIQTASGMSGGPYCYAYDGDGVRVAKAHANGGSCTGTVAVDVLYWRNIAGQTIAETDSAGSTSNAYYHEYVFFAGRRVARSDPSSGSVYYFFVDQVGSTRVVTQASGTVCFEQDYYPYGQEIYTGTQSCPQSYKFTGYERDWETGLDYAFARYYNARLGRFMSVDPLAGDIGDPQSLNRYAYVANNPINFTDPTGLCTTGPDGVIRCTATDFGPVYTGGGGGSPITDSEDCNGGCKPAWKDQKKPKPRQAQIGPAEPRSPVPCRIVDPFLGALEWSLRLGPEFKLGPIEVGGSMYKNITTGETGGSVDFNWGIVGAELDRPTPPGGSLTGSAPFEFSAHAAGFRKNFTTHEPVAFKPSKSWSLGLQVLIGFEVSLNGATFDRISRENEACRQIGGR